MGRCCSSCGLRDPLPPLAQVRLWFLSVSTAHSLVAGQGGALNGVRQMTCRSWGTRSSPPKAGSEEWAGATCSLQPS